MQQAEKVSSGVEGFDLILGGGLLAGRLHLLEGRPGTGKTTLALQFLLENVRRGRKVLYVSLSETADELTVTAASHGWSLAGIELFELVPLEARLDRQQTVLYPSEVELGETVGLITDRIEQSRPECIVIDSLSELRLLAVDPLRYRRQILALKQFLNGRECTTLVLDDLSTAPSGGDLHSLVHGVISLEQRERRYGLVRRCLRVAKMRAADFQSGWHDFVITPGRVVVFASLIAQEHGSEFEREAVSTGVEALDALFGGGLNRATTWMLVGPSGVGKSSLAAQCVAAALAREERVAYFSFDESLETFLGRGRRLGLDVARGNEAGKFVWVASNPTRLSPGEFMWKVRREVEDNDARMVVIDSLNSYFETMQDEHALILQMHELLAYLKNRGVIALLVLAQKGVVGDIQDPIDLSFLSDAVVLLRFFEAGGEVRKCIAVLKKRMGQHEAAIREFNLSQHGVRLGPQLLAFRGVLTGVPTYTGSTERLLDDGAPAP